VQPTNVHDQNPYAFRKSHRYEDQKQGNASIDHVLKTLEIRRRRKSTERMSISVIDQSAAKCDSKGQIILNPSKIKFVKSELQNPESDELARKTASLFKAS
jgi:hypothetical protein